MGGSLYPSPLLFTERIKKDQEMEATDFLVETNNPEYLDKTINSFGAALVGGGMPGGFVKRGDYYVMRVFGNIDFIKFAIESQGYGKIIEELPELV